MNKKYFFFDIDGTLTDNATRKIVPSAKQALDELQANGHFVCLCTGRAGYKSVDFLHSIGLHSMVCAGGGGIFIDDKFVEYVPLDYDKCKAIIREAEAKNIGYVLALDDSLRVYSKDNLFVEQCGGRNEPTEYIVDPKYDIDNIDNVYKMFFALTKENEDILTLKDTLGHLRISDVSLMYQHDMKKTGIEKMMKHLNADVKDVVVFGDEVNDLVMFDDRWFSIAMGNGNELLKEKANYVTDLNVNDGIYKACKKFGWI